MISKIFSLRNWVMKQLMKTDESGIMKIPPKGKVDFGEMIIRENLFKKGIDPKTITSERQLDNILDTPAIPKSERVKPKKPGKVIEVDFDKGRWNKAGGGRLGLSYLLAEDTNERVPLAGGGSGKPPINFYVDFSGSGGKEEKNFLGIEGLTQKGYDYGGTLAADTTFPLFGGELSVGGELGFGRDKSDVDYKGRPIDFLSGVGETKLGDDWNVGMKWRKKFGLGGMDKGRRAFLKLMAALGLTGVGAKYGLAGLLKGGKKQIAKKVTSVPIKNIEGMPSWFKPLVNKVIKEGTEVPSGAERVIVHKTKLPNSKTDVYVNQDLNNGDVWVDLGVEKHGFADGKYGQPVRLDYRASEEIPVKGKKGSIKTKEEFNVEEAEFTGGHPENVKFEETTIEKFGNHASNFDEVEMFATGKVKKVKTKSKPRPIGQLDIETDYASGGRVPLGGGGLPGLIFKLLKNRKKVRAAVDDIFPTGDYKYDAQMAAEALVENNPAAFGGKLYDDLDEVTRMNIYGEVLKVVQSDLGKTLQLKKLSRPTKTLEGIKKTGTIDISDDAVAEEFTRFMKETDPKGHKKIEEIVEITNFDPKGKKGHASGGIARMLGE